jgi:hypothetical protein
MIRQSLLFEKRCFKCGEIKNLSAFYPHKQMADGHLNKCIDCTKADVRLNRRTSDRSREYDRQRNGTEKRKQLWKEKGRKYRTNYPEKCKAHDKLNNALAKGRLVRMACEVCGNEKSQAHHDDYSKPLEVRWLCALHHARHHAQRPF